MVNYLSYMMLTIQIRYVSFGCTFICVNDQLMVQSSDLYTLDVDKMIGWSYVRYHGSWSYLFRSV